MAAQPSPGGSTRPPRANPQHVLQEQEAKVDALRESALTKQAAAAAERAAAADLGAQAVLAAAYCRRLQRLTTLLQQYDLNLQRTLAAVGLGGDGSDAGLVADAELADSLRQLEGQLASAAEDNAGGKGESATVEALLQLAVSTRLPPQLAAAGAPAVLAALQDHVLADVADVNAWPEVAPTGLGAASAAPLGAAFLELQQEQRTRWQAAAQRAQQLERLREEVAASRQALLGADASEATAVAAAAHVQLAAQQAGLRAELQSLERATRAAQEQGTAAAAQGADVQRRVADVAVLEEQEARVDAAVRSLCAADSAAMRAWRQGTWRAQELVQAGVAAQRQPLAELAQQLLEAQRKELAAFCATGTLRMQRSKAGGQQQQAPPPASALAPCVAPAGAGTSAVRGAAQLLDPLAHLKTAEHASGVMAAAAAELRQLQPVHERWQALASGSASQLADLQQAAGELQARVRALQEEGTDGAAMAQLRQAAAAAEEAGALVGRTRQALSEWWTSPAVTATPWVQRDGKTADEWLRLLSDFERTLKQREAMSGKDGSSQRLRKLT